MTQVARPTTARLISSGTGWGGASAPAAINDQDDLTYMQGSAFNSGELGELGNLIDPGVSTGHTFRVRATTVTTEGTGLNQATLWQGDPEAGGVQVGLTLSISTAYMVITDLSYTLSAAEADSITDYTNLWWRLFKSGGTSQVRVYEVWLEIPEAIVYKTASESGLGSDSRVLTVSAFSRSDSAIAVEGGVRTPAAAGEYDEPLPYDGTDTTYDFPDGTFLSSTDFGAVSDTALVLATKSGSDSGIAVDLGSLVTPKQASDVAAAADSVGITAALVLYDDGFVEESGGFVQSKVASESGLVSELAKANVLKPVTEAGVGAEASSKLVNIYLVDGGSSSESRLLAVPGFNVVDSVHGVDMAQQGKVIVVPATARLGEFGYAIQAGGMGQAESLARWAMPLGMPDGSGLPEPSVNWTFHDPARSSVAPQEVRRDLVPWLADFTLPAFTRALPGLLRGLLPADAVAGTEHSQVPSHEDVWFTFFARRPGLVYERYIDGLIEGLRFEFSSGMPVQLGVQAQGRTPEFLSAPWNTNDLEDIRSGWLTYIGADVTFDWAHGPATTVRWECEGGTLQITRPAIIHGNYDGVRPVGMSRGNLDVELSVQLVFRNIDHYRYSVYGAISPEPRESTVYGSATITFFEREDANGRFMQVRLPAVAWEVESPQPLSQPESGHVIVEAVGHAIVPATVGRTGHVISTVTDSGLVSV